MDLKKDEKIHAASAKDAANIDNRVRNGSLVCKARVNFWIDALAFLTFLVTAISGMALMRIHPLEYRTNAAMINGDLLWGLPYLEWMHLHNLIGWTFVALVVVHMVMHWHWIASMLNKRLSPKRNTKHRLKASEN